jgi:hypothetical protein
MGRPRPPCQEVQVLRWWAYEQSDAAVDGTVRPRPRCFRGWIGGGRELAMAEIVVSRLSEDEHSIQLRRAVVASTIGTAIEW